MRRHVTKIDGTVDEFDKNNPRPNPDGSDKSSKSIMDSVKD